MSISSFGVADRGAVHRLVGGDVLGVGRIGALAVHVGDEELPDLLLQAHPADLLDDPAVLSPAIAGATAGGGERGARAEGNQQDDQGERGNTAAAYGSTTALRRNDLGR